MGSVLSPESTSDRVKIGFHDDEGRREWVERYAGVKEWATEEFLYGLIGGECRGGAESDLSVYGCCPQ
jgi:hypothetical protein